MRRLLPSLLFLLASAPFTCVSGGPMPIHRNDSLAVIRLVGHVRELPSAGTALYVGKGLGRISAVDRMTTVPTDLRSAADSAIAGFLLNGYRVENSTEHFEEGLHISTFYLKKRTT
jgi:hypothetical protein